MRCCIAECKSSFKNGVRSHCIPSMSGLRKLWLEAVKIINPGPNDRICSRHFLPSDYQSTGVTESTRAPSLLHDIIPSQNLPTRQTDRGFDQELKIEKNLYHFSMVKKDKEIPMIQNDQLFLEDGGYQLQFDDDIGDDERRFYLKLFPLVNLVREKKTHCTSCNVHLGTAPVNEDNVKMHPILRVSQCKKCHDFYNSGEFSKGEDGSELYCRWCGQGGEVYCCAKCPYVFCKACIGGNLAKSLVADIRDNENWSCFVCSPKITWPIRAVHWALKNYIGKQKQSILLTNTNEHEIRRLMKKDTSICCRGKLGPDEDSSNDSDIPIKKTYTTAASILKKRKRSNEEILGQPKPKILNSILTGSVSATSSSTSNLNTTTAALQKSGVTLTAKNQTLMLNSGLVIQKHPTSTTSNTIIRPIPPNQTQVKIVQLTNQHNKTVNVPINVTKHGTLQSAPPPLLIRNRGVQIREHSIGGGNTQNRSLSNVVQRTQTSTSSSSSSTSNEYTPVYHTIGGFCIDLNSAAQHDSIRLPNGKLIQVKKSSNTTNQTTSPTTIGQRNQIPSGILHQQPTQPQQHFTITQPIHQNAGNNVGGNIQTIPASAIIPNATGSLQILNGNVIQQIQNQQQQMRPANGPMLVRSIFPNTPVGKARNQLQNQIFTAMEICQHLSGKIHTLTNSNPYKNANSHIDVKELYIHLSYLFTYAIGRFKNLQDKCNEEMTSMGFNTDVSKLTKGQLAAEKYASDGDEDEIEIVEPKTTTIDLDSDNEDNIQSMYNKKSNEQTTLSNMGINTLSLKDIQRQQVAKQNQLLRDKQNQQAFKLQQFQEQQKNNMPSQSADDNDYDLPLTLLAGMLEVELTEGNDSLNSTSSGSTLPKKPRKKTTNKPNPHLIKQQQEQLRAKYDEIKRCDFKLKQECTILIDSLDLDIDDVKEAFQRYSDQQNDDDINNYEMNGMNNNDLNSSSNLDDNDVGVMQLLEVTMESGGDELNNSKINITDDDVLNKSENTTDNNENNSQSAEKVDNVNENKSTADNNENNNQSSGEKVDKQNEEEEKMEIDENITNNSEKTDDDQNKNNQKEIENVEDNSNKMETIENMQDKEEKLENIENKQDENETNCETLLENISENEMETAKNNPEAKEEGTEEGKVISEDLKNKDNIEDEHSNEVVDTEIDKGTKISTGNDFEDNRMKTDEDNGEDNAEEKETESNCEDYFNKNNFEHEDSTPEDNCKENVTLGNSENEDLNNKNNFDDEYSKKATTSELDQDNCGQRAEQISEKLKLEDEISINDDSGNSGNVNYMKTDVNITYENNDSNDDTLENSNSINKEANLDLKSNEECISHIAADHTDNYNIADNNIISPDLPVDNGNKNSANIDSIEDIAEEPELKSNIIENESIINKINENLTTIEPMDVDPNLLNIQNSSELIDELLADAVKTTKSSGDDDSPNDFIDDHQLSLLTGD